MPIPAYGTRGMLVVPLSSKFQPVDVTFPANGEIPVPNQWFNAGDVPFIPVNPKISREAVVDPNDPPKPKPIDMTKFFGGGEG